MDPSSLAELFQQARFDGYIAGAVLLIEALIAAFTEHPWILVGLLVLTALSVADRILRRRRRRY